MKVGMVLKRDLLINDLDYLYKVIMKRTCNEDIIEEIDWDYRIKPITIKEYIDKCKKETIKNFIYFDMLVVDDGDIVFNLNTKVIPIDFIFHSFIKECSKYNNDDVLIGIKIKED